MHKKTLVFTEKELTLARMPAHTLVLNSLIAANAPIKVIGEGLNRKVEKLAPLKQYYDTEKRLVYVWNTLAPDCIVETSSTPYKH